MPFAPHAIIIIGPTASGKTAISYDLAHALNGEIINADVGQLYAPLSIGTAKPDWRNNPIKAHLFDVINEPDDFTVHAYRKKVTQLVTSITSVGKIPIIVGGSSFYIKSLLFPTHELDLSEEIKNNAEQYIENIAVDQLWNHLNAIDSDRAQKLHPHDQYRLKRALFIWYATGKKPSSFEPSFMPSFPFFLLIMLPDKKILNARICRRTTEMLKDGWIEEAKLLLETAWEPFIAKKGLIGYSDIFSWLRKGTPPIEEVAHVIQKSTVAYAKRQITFIKSLVRLLNDSSITKKDMFDICYLHDPQEGTTSIMEKFHLFRQNFLVGKK